MQEASNLIHAEAHENAMIIIGAVIDETMGDDIRVTVIATGFGAVDEKRKSIPHIAPAMIMENFDVPTMVRKDRERQAIGATIGKGDVERAGKSGGFYSGRRGHIRYPDVSSETGGLKG